LDIHQNEIGPVPARQIQRLDPIAGTDGLVPVRFQEIVEELMFSSLSSTIRTGLRHSPRPFVPRASIAPAHLPSARPPMVGHDQHHGKAYFITERQI